MTKPNSTARPRRLTAVAYAASALAIALAGMNAAHAQSTAVGSVFGQVAAGSGNLIVVENQSIGLKRTVPVGEGGRFQMGALAPGHYRVQLLNDGKVVSTVELDVLAGQGAEAVFAGATTAQTIEVVGKLLSIDTSSAASGTVFTSKQLDAIPIATKDVNGIVSLAANTTKADSRYAGGISIGGGGPSENAYYINGFPVTNALTQLGSIELPYGAIQQADVKTGGFGAEFGRSVGGVVNIITKSGTNEWHGGGGLSVEPNALRSKPKDIFYGNPGAATDGTIFRYRQDDTRAETSYNGFVGGPLVKDKLFFFLAADQTKTTTNQVNSTPQSSARLSTGWLETEDKNTRYLGKLDWYITDNHRIEATLLGDNYKTTDDYFGYDYATHSKTTASYSQYSKNLANYTPGVGGDAQVLKYSGNITNDLLITALYGQSSSKHSQKFSFLPTAPEVLVNTSTDRDPRLVNFPTKFANPLPGGTTAIPDGAQEKTKSFRFDVEYQLGSHLVRAGVDENRLSSTNAGDSYENTGGSYWRYFRTTNGNYRGSGNGIQTLIQAGATPDANGFYYYARQRIFSDTTNADSNQSAQYIEDNWQVTDNVKVTGGLRNEKFENKNGDGEVFLKMKNFISPRLAATWDVLGNSSMKLFGTAGRYSLQIPTHVAVRGASRSTFTDQFFAYTGADPVTGAPTGTTAINNPFSGNNEYGQAKNPKSVAAEDMKPTFQDELTLGIEKALTPSLTGGAKLTYRKLKATIDDFCDYRPIDAYAAAHGITITNPIYPFGCATINAGEDNTIYLDTAGDGKLTKFALTAADIGLPKPKRTYIALDFFLEHPFSDGWYGKVTYTYSKNKGNTEGQTKSDNGQTDVAVTSTWDFPELMENSYGYLPNDRTHQIKAYGYYQFTPEWGFGSTFVAESGRPKNCFGDYNGSGEDIGGGAYGAVFFYCGGQPSPRGSQGRLPWSLGLDVNGVYKPSMVKGLSARIDIFNVFNRQTARVIDEAHDSVVNYGGLNPAYGRVISYSDPRKVRLSVNYEF